MKPLQYEIGGRSLVILGLVCMLGAPLVGMAAALASQMFSLVPAPISLLLSWSTLIVLSALLFGRAVWLGRIQHPWLVGGAGLLFGTGVYLAFMAAGSRLPPGAASGPMFPGWPGNLPILVSLLAMLLIPNISQSREPVCGSCRRWYSAAEHIGSIPFLQREAFLSLVDRGQISEAGQWIVPEEQAAPPNLEIYRQSCPACQGSDPLITIKETFLNARDMVKRRVSRRGMVSRQEAGEWVRHPAVGQERQSQGDANDL